MQRLTGIVLAAALLALPGAAHAKPVRIMDGDRVLLGNLVVPAGTSMKSGVLLMLHGTLAHLAQETVAGIQKALAERKIPTLAITLSLQESARTGMYTCEKVHRHKHSNAGRELALWHKWLHAQGAGKVALFGHSRGGNQAVNYALSKEGAALTAVVALAPSTWSVAGADAAYTRRFKRDRLLDVRAARRRGNDLLNNHPFMNCPKATVAASSFVDYHRNDPSRNTPALLVGYKAAPLLVIAGGKDQVVPDLAGRMTKIRNPRVTHKLIAEANHMFLDFYAEDVADRIAEFLKGKF